MVDDQVRRAMQKWPQVPDVYGWLRLDRRGRWLLIDPSQADSGDSADAGAGAGSAITSPPIVDFIGRNYECDARGAWYWQNGPQRAFASLELAPLILRVLNEPPRQRLVTHTGYIVERVTRILSDADGNLLMMTNLGPAALDDRDFGQLQLIDDGDGGTMTLLLEQYSPPATSAARSGDGAWRIDAIDAAGVTALAAELGFIADPAAPSVEQH